MRGKIRKNALTTVIWPWNWEWKRGLYCFPWTESKRPLMKVPFIFFNGFFHYHFCVSWEIHNNFNILANWWWIHTISSSPHEKTQPSGLTSGWFLENVTSWRFHMNFYDLVCIIFRVKNKHEAPPLLLKCNPQQFVIRLYVKKKSSKLPCVFLFVNFLFFMNHIYFFYKFLHFLNFITTSSNWRSIEHLSYTKGSL